MTAERFDRLTERQKQCLRFVHDRLQSKQIAARMGISHHTVDDHIRAALQVLGLASRYDAARLLAEFEHPQPPMHVPLGMGEPPPEPVGPDPAAVRCEQPVDADIVRQEGEPYTAYPPTTEPPDTLGMRNHLTTTERISRIATVSSKIVVFIAGTLLVVVLFQQATRVIFDLIR